MDCNSLAESDGLLARDTGGVTGRCSELLGVGGGAGPSPVVDCWVTACGVFCCGSLCMVVEALLLDELASTTPPPLEVSSELFATSGGRGDAFAAFTAFDVLVWWVDNAVVVALASAELALAERGELVARWLVVSLPVVWC